MQNANTEVTREHKYILIQALSPILLLNDCPQNVLKHINRNWLQWYIIHHHFFEEAMFYIF